MTKGQLMAGEMAEQPDVLARLVAAPPRSARQRGRCRPRRPGGVRNRGPRLVRPRCPLGPYLLEIATGRPVALASPSLHTLYRVPVDYRGVLVVGVSQSGADHRDR